MTYQGQCYCKAVSFSCEGEPLFAQYCHCNKCREINANAKRDSDKLGYAYTTAYLTKDFAVTGQLEELIRNNSRLLVCANCKSLIYGISLDPSLQAGIGINTNNFIFEHGIPPSFAPVRHIWYDNHIVAMNDDLPKYKDAPKEQFGTGELYGNDQS